MNLSRNILGALGINKEKENLPEGLIRDPNTGEIILDPNRADKNIIMGQSDPGLFESTSRRQASNRIAQEMLKDRMPEGGKARITGLRTHQYHVDPKTGTAYALADTSGDAGVKFTPLTPPPKMESTGNRTLDVMAQNRESLNQPTTTGSDAPSWVENPPPGHVVGSGASRDLQMSISKAEMAGRMKGGAPVIERYFDQNTGQTYTLHPIAGGEDSDYTLEPQDDGSVKRTNKAFIQKPTEEELIKQELEDTRPDTTTTAPPPPPPEALPETSPPPPETLPPITRPTSPAEEGPAPKDNTGLDLNLASDDSISNELPPPKESPVGQDYSGFGRAEDRLISELARKANLPPKEEQLVSEGPSPDQRSSDPQRFSPQNRPISGPAYSEPLYKQAGRAIENLELPSSDPQRRVLAEEAYGGPIENPPPMDDEIIKKLISSDPSVDESSEFNRGEANIPIEGKTIADPDATRVETIQNGDEDELLQKMVESEFVGPRQGPRELTTKYEDQGPITPLRSEDLRPRTQAFVDPSASGFGGREETPPITNIPGQEKFDINEAILSGRVSPLTRKKKPSIQEEAVDEENIIKEKNLRTRAEEVVAEMNLPHARLQERAIQKVMNDLRNPSYGTGESLMVEPGSSGVLKAPGFTSVEDAYLNARRGLGVDAPQNQIVGESQNYTTEQLREMAAKDKAIMEETLDQEVIPISEGEEAVNQLMLEDRSRIDDLEPIPAKVREARIDPVTQMATPVTEEKEQSFFGKIGQLIKNNPEVAAQIAQLGGGLISGAAQGKAQRKADAETQRRLARANLTGAFTGRTPAVQAATADPSGFFSLDTLGKAIGGGGAIAQDKIARGKAEKELQRKANLEQQESTRKDFEAESRNSWEIERNRIAALDQKSQAQDRITRGQNASRELDINEQKYKNDNEYNIEKNNLTKLGYGLEYLNTIRAGQQKDPLPEKLQEQYIKKIGIADMLDDVEELTNAAGFGQAGTSLTVLKWSGLEQLPQFMGGKSTTLLKQAVNRLVQTLGQEMSGVLSNQDIQFIKQYTPSADDRADVALAKIRKLRNELAKSSRTAFDVHSAYFHTSGVEPQMRRLMRLNEDSDAKSEKEFDALAQQFIQGGGN